MSCKGYKDIKEFESSSSFVLQEDHIEVINRGNQRRKPFKHRVVVDTNYMICNLTEASDPKMISIIPCYIMFTAQLQNVHKCLKQH